MTKVRGLENLDRRLAALALVGKKSNLELALTAGGLKIANRAKSKAPYITGTLRRSLHVGGFTTLTPDFNASEPYDDLGKDAGADSAAVIKVGTNLEYARYVEFGTSRRTATPYLRPAFDETKDAAIQEVREALKELVEAAAGG